MKICIYALIDPRTEKVRYVGQSREVFERLKQHLRREAWAPVYKSEWLRELREAGFMPTLRLLEEVSEEDADAAERRQIAFYASPDLLNWKYPPKTRRLDVRPATTQPFNNAGPGHIDWGALIHGKVNRSRPLLPCGVCKKIVYARPGGKAAGRHKFKGAWCKGGIDASIRSMARARGGVKSRPIGQFSDRQRTRQEEWRTSKDRVLAPNERQRTIAAQQAKKERLASAWLESVKARKATP